MKLQLQLRTRAGPMAKADALRSQRQAEQDPYETTATGGGGNPSRIDIVFDPAKSSKATPCDKIVFIQVMQFLVDGKPVDPGDLEGGCFEYRDNTVIDDLPDTEANEQGQHVDRLRGRREPYYGGDAPGTGSSTSGRFNGTTTPTSRPARMTDTPFEPASSFSSGPTRGNDFNADTITYKFETCAFCACGEDRGKFFECITWEYTRTKADVAAGRRGTSRITGRSSEPTPGFRKAVTLWAEVNYFDLPKDP